MLVSPMIENARQLFSTVTEDDELVLSIEPLAVEPPADDEIVVEMRAVPINPSDLGTLLAPADVTTARRDTVDGHPALVADIQPGWRRMVQTRVGKKMAAGNEGAGVVVDAGDSDAAQRLLGKTVTVVGGKMYRTHRVMKANMAVPLPDGAEAIEGASLFVNPMTVQCFLETMRDEGHSAIVHTAAASNLGQMLAKLCIRQDVPLVAVVRKDSQRELLAELGVTHIVDSTSDSFMPDLIDAIAETGATLGFDAVGGGPLANKILTAMEQALVKRGEQTSVYGVPIHKQVYIYGRLDPGTTELTASYGMYWSVGGWLLTPELDRVGMKRTIEMRQFAVEERNGIFDSHYTQTIGLDEMIDPEVARAYQRKATGEKYLVNPAKT